ncbi:MULTISPECIES: hypothetical protein [Thermus]|jgi:hypothetical protein|uniref:Uncharacterized protein n=1 Tax=Thermus brockianus TaxID=56956 RepID=A0A1J0LTB7_THEBO|nr:hypothetical protein [Thermus brockianus]APD09346.1 hypothetical protein A0O31_01207 [Thermus brockianus]
MWFPDPFPLAAAVHERQAALRSEAERERLLREALGVRGVGFRRFWHAFLCRKEVPGLCRARRAFLDAHPEWHGLFPDEDFCVRLIPQLRHGGMGAEALAALWVKYLGLGAQTATDWWGSMVQGAEAFLALLGQEPGFA